MYLLFEIKENISETSILGQNPSKKKVLAAMKQHHKVASTCVRAYCNPKKLQNDPLEGDTVNSAKGITTNNKSISSTQIAKPLAPNENHIISDIDCAFTEDFDNTRIDYDISMKTHTININEIGGRRKVLSRKTITPKPAVKKSKQGNDNNRDSDENIIEDYSSENNADSEKGNSDDENNSINLAGMNGHRIVNMRHVLIWAFSIERHRSVCKDAEIEFIKEERDKFRSTYTFVCKTCDKRWVRHTEP